MMRHFAAALALLFATPAMAQEPTDPIRVLIYGDSNSWGWRPIAEGFPAARYPDHVRFAGIIQAELGDGYMIVVDGLNNRTTDLNDPIEWGNVPPGAFNGAANLPAAIAREQPLDVVIVMLGTNDLKTAFGRSPGDIARGARRAAEIAIASEGVATVYGPPRVLLVTPPPLGEISHPAIAELFSGAIDKSEALSAAFAAEIAGSITLVDAAASMGRTDGIDGVHFSEQDHRQLGEALADAVRAMLNPVELSPAENGFQEIR